jgi:hypothetical protein
MRILRTEEIASMVLFEVRLSDSELQTLADAMGYVLHHLNKAEIHKNLLDEDEQGMETPEQTYEFMQARYVELMNAIRAHGDSELLPKRFREWNVRPQDDM